MWRSLWLIGAGCCLLGAFACAGAVPAKAHAPKSARRQTSGSEERPRPRSGNPTVESQVPENTENLSAAAGRDPGASRSIEDLSERYGKAPPLAVQRGSASYYGSKFSGRATASGVAYNPRAYTAAHRSLPFGTVLRVTRLDGRGKVYVTVTDRGPYGPRGRILDLSHAAAERLDMLRAGVVPVKVEVVEYGARKARRRKR